MSSKKIKTRILRINTLEALVTASPFVSLIRPNGDQIRCESVTTGSRKRCKMQARYVYQTYFGPQKCCIHHVWTWIEYDRWDSANTWNAEDSAGKRLRAFERRLAFEKPAEHDT